MLVYSCFVVSGCKEEQQTTKVAVQGQEKLDKIMGLWRCEKPTYGGFHNITFTEKELLTGTASPGSSYTIAYDIRDNVIAVRQAGTDHVLFTVDFIDDNKIKTTYDVFCPSEPDDGIFVRASQSEVYKLNAEYKQQKEQRDLEIEEEIRKSDQGR